MSSTILILTLQKFDFASTVLFLLHELQLSPVKCYHYTTLPYVTNLIVIVVNVV